jgi:hypothetical protein
LWDQLCEPTDINLWPPVWLFAAITPLIGITWLLAIHNPLGLRLLDPSLNAQAAFFHRVWPRLQQCLCFAGMWTFLGLVTAYRGRFGAVVGPSVRDNDWTFGQALAAATWIPVFLDFLYIFICESSIRLLPR